MPVSTFSSVACRSSVVYNRVKDFTTLYSEIENLWNFCGTFVAADCFELGKHAYNDNDYYHTVLWMDEALEKLDREDRKPTIKKSVILDYLSFATSMVRLSKSCQ